MYDFIIIGQGLAGSILAYMLIKKNKKVLVINDETRISASQASVGIFNPVTGKRMTKTWKAEEIFPFLATFYQELGNSTGEDLIHFMPVYKPFSSVTEQNEWLTKAEENEYRDFINTNVPSGKYGNLVNAPAGGFETKQSGFVRVDKVIENVRSFLKERNAYINQSFDYSSITDKKDHVTVSDKWEAKKLIFCEGIYSADNPWFSYLPFSGLKGETLDIRIRDYDQEVILNKSAFVIPWSQEIFKTGSVYVRNYTNAEPTDEGEEQITKKLRSFFLPEFEVTGRKAGIRPTTVDRRPILGLHPGHKTFVIFNGLGTKGVSLAPYFAAQLVEHLLNNKDLDPEVDISRFSSIYSGFNDTNV
jgi:glycine/D-amino acid oxidase-like deaminating enzyme